jgi:hypothetical protein
MRAFDETTGIEFRADDGHDEVDDASRDSFPASDPPSWTGLRLGSPPVTQPGPAALEQESLRNKSRIAAPTGGSVDC